MEQSMPSYEQTGSDLDTCQASKILNPNFLWCFRFLFPLQENTAEIQDARPFDFGIDIMDAMENQLITWKLMPNALIVNCFYTQSFFIVDC